VPNLDDEEFESYLRKFRPQEPQRLPGEVPVSAGRHPPRLAGLALLAAASLVLGIIALHIRANHFAPAPGRAHQSWGEYRMNSRPLTLGVANRLLTDSPSLETALDSLGAEPRTPAIPKGKDSALAVLSEVRP
jgi:hypothetical protein